MIGVDVDQIYGIIELIISRTCDYSLSRIKYLVSRGQVIFPANTPFIPKEIYNIISIGKIVFYDIRQKLVIGNRIINLHNIRSINITMSPNIVISRHILKLPLCNFVARGATGYEKVYRYMEI